MTFPEKKEMDVDNLEVQIIQRPQISREALRISLIRCALNMLALFSIEMKTERSSGRRSAHFTDRERIQLNHILACNNNACEDVMCTGLRPAVEHWKFCFIKMNCICCRNAYRLLKSQEETEARLRLPQKKK